MYLLVIIGAGASADAWTEYTLTNPTYQRLPLASELFSSLPVQNDLLDRYNLMGLASILRQKAKSQGKDFDIEAELAILNDKKDLNMIQGLFKTRFYLHEVINILAQRTRLYTHSHTTYIDLLNHLKQWIDQAPATRFVDVVVFNYDNLIEKAMEHVYSYDWYSKNKYAPLSAYYSGRNLRIYKPHGSINWGREITKNDIHFTYNSVEEAFHEFNSIEIVNSFKFIDPDDVIKPNISKNYIPAIAVPYKGKTNFEECPQDMQLEMLNAVNRANKIITLGWKGSDENFTKLLKTNSPVDEVYIISPRGETQLDKIFPKEKIKRFESTFRYFVSDTPTLETLLNKFF